LAKKVSLLFDRIYLTHDLEVTCENRRRLRREHGNSHPAPIFAEARLALYTEKKLGYDSGEAFVGAYTAGVAGVLHRRLIRVGNPYMSEETRRNEIHRPARQLAISMRRTAWHPRFARGMERSKNQDAKDAL